jgi:hypothetical protein
MGSLQGIHIDAAAAEKLSQHLLGVYNDEEVTVQDAYDLGITPLRPSEPPILKVAPAGTLQKSASGAPR